MTFSQMKEELIDSGKLKLGSYRIEEKSGIKKVKYKAGEDGQPEPIGAEVICKKPIIPTAIMDNNDTQTQKVEVAVYDKKRWRMVVLNRERLTNKSKVVQLADYGFPVGSDNAGELARYFNSVLADSDESLPRKTALSVMGWAEDEDGNKLFMPFTDEIGFDGSDAYGALFNAISQKGTESEWIEYVAPLRENLELRLTMAASFASPIVELVGENPFVLHLWGGTGSGKTVSVLVAMSIWGNPKMGCLTRTMNMTKNSMLSTAAFLNSIPFAGDELQTIKSRWQNYDDLIMQVTEGIDRGRMSYDKLNETKSWRCAFLFSGEEPCVKFDSGGGAVNRVIQIECKGKMVQSGNKVANFVRSHYGTVAPRFVEILQSGRYDLNVLYESYVNDIMSSCDTTDKQAGAMALLLTADFIASTSFWPSEQQISIKDVEQYLASASNVDVTERAYNYLCGTVSENSANFDPDTSRTVWGRNEKDGTVLINKGTMVRLLHDAGFDFEACKLKWQRNGYIEKNKTGRYQYYTSLNGVPTYCIKLRMPAEETESESMTDYTGKIPF